jgi:hypothetical protein
MRAPDDTSGWQSQLVAELSLVPTPGDIQHLIGLPCGNGEMTIARSRRHNRHSLPRAPSVAPAQAFQTLDHDVPLSARIADRPELRPCVGRQRLSRQE